MQELYLSGVSLYFLGDVLLYTGSRFNLGSGSCHTGNQPWFSVNVVNKPCIRLLNTLPSIHHHFRPVDELPFIAREEETHVRDILHLRQPSQRHIPQELLPILRCIRQSREHGEEPRPSEQGADAVDTDIVRAIFSCEAFCSLVRMVSSIRSSVGDAAYVGDSPLGRIIPYQPWSWSRCPRGRDVNHRSALALLDKTRHEGFRAVENTPDVDVEDALPFLLGDFYRRL